MLTVELTVSGLDDDFADRLLNSIAILLEDNRHIEHLLVWVRHLITVKKRKFSPNVLLAIEKALTVKYSQLSKM